MPKLKTHSEYMRDLLCKNDSYKNGEFYVVGNILSNQILKLYPSTGSQFNGFPANQAINITGSAAALCFYASSSAANAWIVVTQGT